MVGLFLRFLDVSLAFIGCHWAADKQGAIHVEDRIQDARGVLEGMAVGGSPELVDGHLLVHHVIIMGDLNFRCQGTGRKDISMLER